MTEGLKDQDRDPVEEIAGAIVNLSRFRLELIHRRSLAIRGDRSRVGYLHPETEETLTRRIRAIGRQIQTLKGAIS